MATRRQPPPRLDLPGPVDAWLDYLAEMIVEEWLAENAGQEAAER
jgi:hypothetical protein